MLGAAQDQIPPIRLSGHTLDKATKAKVRFSVTILDLIFKFLSCLKILMKILEEIVASQLFSNFFFCSKFKVFHFIKLVTFDVQVTLENYYSNLIAQHVERQQRLAKLEETLRDEGLSESQKAEKRQQHAIKETEFLRLKRSRLGVEDFEPLKGKFVKIVDICTGQVVCNFQNYSNDYFVVVHCSHWPRCFR